MRPRAVLTTAAAIAAAVMFAGPAQAAITAGAVDPNTTLPATMSDGITTLGLCADNSGFCTSVPPDPGLPVSVPDNFDQSGEAFWMLANASVSGGLAEFAVEASFLNGIVPGGGSVFGRIRYRMDLDAGTYRIRHPFGTSGPYEVTTGGAKSLNVTDDAFDLANVTGIIQWDPGVNPTAPAGYIGNAVTPHKISGAPSGLNAVVVEKLVPGDPTAVPATVDTWAEVDSTDLFTLEGRTSDGTVPAAVPFIGVSTNTVAFGARRGDQASSPKKVLVRNNGAAPLTISGLSLSGPNAGDFRATGCVGTLQPRTNCEITVTFPGSPPVGDRSATLSIASDGVNASNLAVTLSGAISGLAPAPAPSPQPQPQGPAAQAPAPTATTLVQVVPGAGATVAGPAAATTPPAPAAPAAPAGQAVQGAVARPLALGSLTLSQRISITRLRIQGLRLTMRLEEGTHVVRIAVYRAKGNGQRTGSALFAGYYLPTKSGLFRATLRDRKVLRKLRAGQYVVEVQPGQVRTSLGQVARHRFRVTP